MKNKKLIIALLGLLLLLSVCGLIFALTSVAVTNHFETGIVDISLTEYQKVGNNEIPWQDNPTVMPGEIVSKIPRVHNDGNDCYVRARIMFRDTDQINESNLSGISDKWIKADDGYYYYTDILPHGEDADIFYAVNIPADLPEETQGQIFHIDIDVDAIQSQNFTPQFNAAQPWGSIEILECEKEGMYDISTFKQADTQSFQIVYQGSTRQLIKNSDDFFSNFPYLMPGDIYSDVVLLPNKSSEDIKLYFRTENVDDSVLLEKIQLKITADIGSRSEVFYEGDLNADELNTNTLLGVIPKGREGVFRFEISVPAELNNAYTILSSSVKWIFSTEPIPEPVNVDTGDDANILLWTTLCICTGIACAAFIVLFARNKKQEEQ